MSARYQCLACGSIGNSTRCGYCGGDAEPLDEDSSFPFLADTEAGGSYTIFDHAQGVRTCREVSQEKL